MKKERLVKKSEAQKLISEMVSGLDAEVKGYLDHMKGWAEEGDWSFVIKCHALIEAAVTELIVQHLGEEKLRKIVERVSLNDTQVGKLVMARDMEIIDEECFRFIRKFSELRNKLAHRLVDVNFTFKEHIANLDKAQRKGWIEWLTLYDKAEPKVPALQRLAIENPSAALYIAVVQTVSLCALQTANSKVLRGLEKL